ncbi:hypothetical protein ACHHYP_04397 [Achlya hypogyna]|uniref:M96 mating-specific protein family n=1 Tax=Achlya hypogyna TaxID=1202772 RepID=A0A1V9Z164_ACHHY|nr:hypothetical protein ACHHYP_04397 [Achlya hypogyna]
MASSDGDLGCFDEPTDNDFLQDIQFLIATDPQLTEDLSQLCAILDASSSDSDRPPIQATLGKRKAPSSDTGRGQPNRFQVRQKKEILRLREQVQALQSELTRSRRVMTPPEPTKWEAIAKEERQAKTAVLQENEQLKAAVAHQSTFIETMQRYLRKKPRLELLRNQSSDAWKAYTLAAKTSLRIAAIGAIADRQYSRQQSTFLRLGLVDRTEDLVSIKPMVKSDGTVIMEYIYHLQLPAPFDAIGAAAWQVFSGADGPSCPPDATQEVEIIDDDTSYETFVRPVPHSARVVYSNRITKRYAEDGRHLIVWRTVLNDERMPQMAAGCVEDECGWYAPVQKQSGDALRRLLSAPGPTPGTCLMSFVLSVVSGLSAADVALGIETYSFGKAPTEKATDVINQPPKSTMAALMDKGKRLEIALRAAVARAIADYKTSAVDK